MDQLHKAAIYISGLSYKACVALSVPIGTLLGIVFGEAATNQWGAATLAGVIAGGFTTIVTILPRIMEQRRKSRLTDAEVRETATANLITRLQDSHKTDMAALRQLHVQEVEFLKRVIAEKELVATLERQAKHDAVAEWTDAATMLAVYASILKEAGKEAPPYTTKTYKEVVGKADEEIKAIATARVADSPLTPNGNNA